ncbi:MAG TPA: NAD-dependent malic enzyme [Anaerolineales bacterium]|nr:NAD-dependent malic enzyme [Anaerolineales bacterium]
MSQVKTLKRGVDVLRDPSINRGTAFTLEERRKLGLRGLLPPTVTDIDNQIARFKYNLTRKANNLERYLALASLQNRSETLFYRVMIDNIEEMMPLVYTPTVGQACQEFGHIYRRAQGMYVSINDAGEVAELIDNWHEEDVRCVVVTDGERILGLGDLGANGMGIPIGKLALYTACGGVHPRYCLPVTIDVGTNNSTLLEDPLYLGLKQTRLRGEAYDALVDEFVKAVTARYPNAMVQFEDFGNTNAFRFLEKYRNQVCAFNDDIQGTGAIALAGLFSATRITGQPITQQKILFLGAGEAGVGIADIIVTAMVEAGLSLAEARRQCWFVDSTGLVTAQRKNLAHHKLNYAHDFPGEAPDFLSAVRALRPTAIIGVSGQPNTFTPEIIAEMAQINARPIIFALSNPTSKAECTATSAYSYSNGTAIFASGSPFAPVEYNGKTFVPGQGNNAYIFPGIGLAVASCAITRVTNEMLMIAAQTVADLTDADDLALGRVYPSLSQIRQVSAEIAIRIAEYAFTNRLSSMEKPQDIRQQIEKSVYNPAYD